MAVLRLSEKLVERLQRTAADRHESIEDLLEHLLDAVEPAPMPENPNQLSLEEYPPGTFGRLLATALEMPYFEGQRDIAERSREILENEFAEYLIDRMKSTGQPHPESPR